MGFTKSKKHCKSDKHHKTGGKDKHHKTGSKGGKDKHCGKDKHHHKDHKKDCGKKLVCYEVSKSSSSSSSSSCSSSSSSSSSSCHCKSSSSCGCKSSSSCGCFDKAFTHRCCPCPPVPPVPPVTCVPNALGYETPTTLTSLQIGLSLDPTPGTPGLAEVAAAVTSAGASLLGLTTSIETGILPPQATLNLLFSAVDAQRVQMNLAAAGVTDVTASQAAVVRFCDEPAQGAIAAILRCLMNAGIPFTTAYSGFDNRFVIVPANPAQLQALLTTLQTCPST